MCGAFKVSTRRRTRRRKRVRKEQHGSTFQKDEKVQINIQGKRVLYVGASVRDLSIFCFCQKYSEITL